MFFNPFASCWETRKEKKKIQSAKSLMTRLDDRESQLEQDLEELENDITKMTHTIKSLHRANRKEQAKIDMQKLLAKRMRIQMIKKEMAGITQQKTFIEMHASGEEQSKIARDFAAVTRQFVGESRLNDLDRATEDVEDAQYHQNEIELRMKQLFSKFDTTTEEIDLDKELAMLVSEEDEEEQQKQQAKVATKTRTTTKKATPVTKQLETNGRRPKPPNNSSGLIEEKPLLEFA